MIQNPFVHWLAGAASFAIGIFLESNSPILALTVGAILTGVLHIINQIAA